MSDNDDCPGKVKGIETDMNFQEMQINKALIEVLKKEGETLLKKLEGERQIVALCVEGKQMASEKFAEFLEQSALMWDSLCFVIGGSHGLWEAVKQRSDRRLSFSEMTLPHQLMRVVLTEQIYRGFKINSGEQYHK